MKTIIKESNIINQNTINQSKTNNDSEISQEEWDRLFNEKKSHEQVETQDNDSDIPY